jgi:hypothetical protein
MRTLGDASVTPLQNYQDLLETSRRVNWHLEDLIGEGRRLDFTRPFLPETFAQTEPLGFLSSQEKLKLNQIRARGYLALFELVEAFIVPFISDQADDCAAWPMRLKSIAGSSARCSAPATLLAALEARQLRWQLLAGTRPDP